MHFNLGLSSLLSTALLLSPAAAAHFYFYVGRGCSGSSVNSYNQDAYYCNSVVGFTAASVYFDGVPSGGKGQIYNTGNTDCSGYLGEGGSGSYCLSGTSIRSANWFYPYKKLVRKEEALAPQRYGVTYPLPDSTFTEVEVPLKDVELAWKLLVAEDYEALSKYPTFVHDA